jgi:c-di-GMP-binding flagellar brake protein YcgR
VLRGSVLDLSRGGISVAIAANLDVAEILELQFTLPYAAKPVCTEAVIRRREGYRYSLEFVCMTASEQEKVDRTCAVLALLQ